MDNLFSSTSRHLDYNMQNQIENLYKFILENNPIATNNINSTLDRGYSNELLWEYFKTKNMGFLEELVCKMSSKEVTETQVQDYIATYLKHQYITH